MIWFLGLPKGQTDQASVGIHGSEAPMRQDNNIHLHPTGTYVSDCWMDFIPSEKSCFSSWNGVMPIFLFSSEAYLTLEPRTCLSVVISPST